MPCHPLQGCERGGLAWCRPPTYRYPHEREVLFGPLLGQQPLVSRIEGGTLVVETRMSLNMMSLTLEQVLNKRHRLLKEMGAGMASEVRAALTGTGYEAVGERMLEAQVRQRGVLYNPDNAKHAAEWFNDDTHFKEAVVAIVDAKQETLSADRGTRLQWMARELSEEEVGGFAGLLQGAVQELKGAGFTAQKLRAGGFTAEELRVGGFSAEQLREVGFTVDDLRAGGFNAAELRVGGSTAEELRVGGFTAEELRVGGFKAEPLRVVGFTSEELLACGFTATELRAGGFQVEELRAAVGATCIQAKAAGYSLLDAKALGYSLQEAKAAGYELEEAAFAGYSLQELTEANIKVADSKQVQGLLRKVGGTWDEAIRANQLNWTGKGLNDEDADAVALVMRFSAVLEKLWLGFNKISDAGASAIADALSVNAVLKALWLNDNNLTQNSKSKLRDVVKGREGFSWGPFGL